MSSGRSIVHPYWFNCSNSFSYLEYIFNQLTNSGTFWLNYSLISYPSMAAPSPLKPSAPSMLFLFLFDLCCKIIGFSIVFLYTVYFVTLPSSPLSPGSEHWPVNQCFQLTYKVMSFLMPFSHLLVIITLCSLIPLLL